MPYKCRLDEETGKWMGWIGEEQKEVEEPEYPSADKVNEWNRTSMGHDSINQWICVEARAKHLGVYGKCEFCEGKGQFWYSDEIEQLYENFEGYPPPEGEGFQLWSTTTEGHPMTPVFASLELLCEHLDKEKVSSFGSFTASKVEWMRMLDSGHVYHKEGNKIFI